MKLKGNEIFDLLTNHFSLYFDLLDMAFMVFRAK